MRKNEDAPARSVNSVSFTCFNCPEASTLIRVLGDYSELIETATAVESIYLAIYLNLIIQLEIHM